MYPQEYQDFDKCVEQLKQLVTTSRLITYTGYKVSWYHKDIIYAGIRYILTTQFNEITVEWGKKYPFKCCDIASQREKKHYFKVYDWDSYYFTYMRKVDIKTE